MVLGCVCVTVPVGIRAAFLGTCIWSLGVGDHDNVYLVAFLSGCYFFYFFYSTLLFFSAFAVAS
jgi:hypothetical protein